MNKHRTNFLLAIFVCFVHGIHTLSLEQSNAIFTNNLYHAVLDKHQTDFVLSPLSVLTDLSIAYLGARGQTSAELKHVLHLTGSKDSTASAFRLLLKPLQKENSTLKVANKIYVNENNEIHANFNAIAKRDFFTSVDRLDFKHSNRAARTINAYVADKTNNLIKDLISPSMLSPSTQTVLINAVYFNGAWERPFAKWATKKEPFYTGPTSSVLVDTMHLTARNIKYAEIDELDAKLVGMVYKGRRYCFQMLIPNDRSGLSKLEERLSTFDLNTFQERLSLEYIQLSMPKFKTKFTVSLNEPLQKLGIRKAFSPAADFGGMLIKSHNVGISDVVHQAYINVDEGGTVAAAATGIVTTFTSTSLPELPLSVQIDHPFIYYLVDSKNNNIFFVGRYTGK